MRRRLAGVQVPVLVDQAVLGIDLEPRRADPGRPVRDDQREIGNFRLVLGAIRAIRTAEASQHVAVEAEHVRGRKVGRARDAVLGD
jgi:hypothetical protein